MKVVLYANGFSGVGERLQNIIEALVPKRQTWICKTVDSLRRKLRRPMNGVSIAILLAATKEELLVIYSMKELFEGIRIILILPDRKGDTISLGHKLYPRFFSYADGDFRDVAMVLEKMLANGYLSNGSNRNQTKH